MTRLLLDTNAWLWMMSDSDRLGRFARAVVTDDATDLVLSAVCAWEISIKWALGRLSLPLPPAQFVDACVEQAGLTRLQIDFDHVVKVASLPPLHHDPFDRLLIAQAQATGLAVLTSDPVFRTYGIATIDATI